MTATAPQAAEHDVTIVPATLSGRGYRAWCRGCGWTSPGCIAEGSAQELAAIHFLGTGGATDDDSAELLACIARHPAGKAVIR